jgi:hypothetical protein
MMSVFGAVRRCASLMAPAMTSGPGETLGVLTTLPSTGG